jgi:hypothetical protein
MEKDADEGQSGSRSLVAGTCSQENVTERIGVPWALMTTSSNKQVATIQPSVTPPEPTNNRTKGNGKGAIRRTNVLATNGRTKKTSVMDTTLSTGNNMNK